MSDDFQVQVSQWDGQQLRIQATKLVHRVTPDKLFDAVTGLEASSAFRNIQAVQERRVLHDDGAGRVTVEQVQVQRVGFLMFSHLMRNKLSLHMDRNMHQVTFKLLEPGTMKDFQGHWRMTPTCCDHVSDVRRALQQLDTNTTATRPSVNQHNHAMKRCKQTCTLVELQQTVQPAFVPPLFGRIAQRMAAKETKELMEDLAAAAFKT